MPPKQVAGLRRFRSIIHGENTMSTNRLNLSIGKQKSKLIEEKRDLPARKRSTRSEKNERLSRRSSEKKSNKIIIIKMLLLACLQLTLALSFAQFVAASQQQLFGPNSPSAVKSNAGASSLQNSEVHQVRGLAGSGRLELPCLVDQLNCGEVYYITWTRQSAYNQTVQAQKQQQQQQQPWNRVYLYTGANDSAPHKPIGDLINRAHFVMPDKRPTVMPNDEEAEQRNGPPLARLMIEEPKLSDEALYKCDVTYVKGKCPSISLVRVSMMSLPNKAQIFHSPSSLAAANSGQLATVNTLPQLPDGQLVGPFNEHEQLRLTCLVQGGRPEPSSVIWRKIDSAGRTTNLMAAKPTQQHLMRQPPNSPGQIEQSVQVELNHVLTSADLGAKFECHVEHDALEQAAARVVSNELGEPANTSPDQPDGLLDLHPARSSESLPEGSVQSERPKSLDAHVLIDLNVGVASVDLFMAKVNRRNSSEPLKEGDLVELECVAYNSRPAANITWLNGSDSIEQLELVTQASAMPAGPSPRHHISRQKRLLQRNQVHLNSDGHTFTTHSFLSIKLSRHENRAQIMCQAQNAPMRQPLVKSIELQVQHAPIVLMEPAGGLLVSEHSAAELSQHKQPVRTSERADNVIGAPELRQTSGQVSIYCIYSANPSQLAPNSTRWFKNGQLLEGLSGEQDETPDQDAEGETEHSAIQSVKRQHLVESFTQTGYPVLTINQVNRRDAGLYDCQLANSVGSSERLPAGESCRLEVNFRPQVQLRLYRVLASARADQASYQPDELAEMDPNQELVMPGGHFVLVCDVLEAQPNKIDKFHWFKGNQLARGGHSQKDIHSQRPAAASGRISSSSSSLSSVAGSTGEISAPDQVIARTESAQFSLGPLAANFTASQFACAASNSLGPSEPSNRIELQLSYAPGPSLVRPIFDPTLRKIILKSGRPAHQTMPVGDVTETETPNHQQQFLPAGRELLLECATQDFGQPRANIWLWFKNGQPIEGSNNINNPNSEDLLANQDNPITSQNLSPPPMATQPGSTTSDTHHRRRNGAPTANSQHHHQQQPVASSQLQMEEQSKIRLISSGRYLFIPSIQLVHKGNYSCVAVNRLGASGPQSSAAANLERDSYQIRVALAPSFVQPLPSRTYWPEVYVPSAVTTATTSLDQLTNSRQLELVCHVQCEPICQIEWLRNNEPLDLNRQSASLSSNFVTYQVRQSILDENIEANLFKSVESKLVLQFREHTNNNGHTGGEPNLPERQLDTSRVLERRHLLSGANYTCQSSPNSIGPPVRSTTKFIVQYPPENLIINAPSDKLSLVEGGNGPRLSCESAGEPQVQFRWLLAKSNAGHDLALASSSQAPVRQNAKRSVPISQSSQAGTSGEPADYAINQVASKAFEFASPSSKGANDVDAAGLAETELIELAGAVSEAGIAPQTYISTLDLSNLSLDRRQSGHYICEASNRLGQARKSVYVNVQYKPTCAALHLHSLDITTKLIIDNELRGEQMQNQLESNFIQSGSYVKPAKATNHDEYAIVKETSEDFITLRKKLVLSPLPHQSHQDYQNFGGELPFNGRIFQSILHDKVGLSDSGETLNSSPTDNSNRMANLKDRDTLLNLDNKSDIKNQMDNSLIADDKLPQKGSGDSWNKFNSLLLKFLNSYMKQVKTYEEQLLIDNEFGNLAENANRQSNRRSDQMQNNAGKKSDTSSSISGKESTRNLITFACMAQDGNPISNLTFDWSFSSTNLPEIDETSMSSSSSDQMEQRDGKEPSIKPVLIYLNDNYTVQVMLVKRLDTRMSLNPFQMSLLTLNVVVKPTTSLGGSTASPPNRAIRETEWNLLNRNSTTNGHGNLIPRAPVIRSRQPSHYNSLGAAASTNNNNNNNNNNIQFARELETRPYNLGWTMPLASELNEENWQEQIGNLLKCTITNRIGTSEVCHVRLNLAERLKNQLSSTSSLSEFAKWRMPSLAHKSVLIISIGVGFSVLIFVAFALLINPYLRNLTLKSSSDLRCCKEETNTGQSTSSQKSSVLGLLGNGGDSSLQSSSDDDSSARLNHHLHHRLHQHQHHHHLLQNQDNMNRCSDRMGLDVRDVRSQTLAQTDNYHNQLAREANSNYDQPRGLHEPSIMYHDGVGLSFNETPDKTSATLDSCHYRNDLTNAKLATSQAPQTLNASDLNDQHLSTRGRLLANLKSLSKFKVDRISDMTNFPSRLGSIRGLHTKDISNSGTNTTGLSVSAFDADTSQKLESPASSGSPTFFGPVQPRNYLSYRGQQMGQLAHSYRMNNQTGFLNDFEDSTSKLQMQLNSQRLLNSTLSPAYSNMINNKSFSPLNDFAGHRELDPSIAEQNDQAAFYRSQTTRNQHANPNYQPMYMINNDLAQFHPQQINRGGPPVYPRSSQTSTLYKLRLAEEALRPSIAARSSNRQTIETMSSPNRQQFQTSSIINRLSMPTYNQSFGARPNDVPPIVNLNYMNTIDSHLNRVVDTVALSQYPDHHQSQSTAYVNTGRDGFEPSSQQHDVYNSDAKVQNQSNEHIYDTNAYATPEQTPMRSNIVVKSSSQPEEKGRPRVSQLIQTFNSRAPPE